MTNQKNWNRDVDKRASRTQSQSTRTNKHFNILDEQNSNNCHKRYSLISNIILPILFAIFTFYMMAVKNSDVLYAIQEHSIFQFSLDFLKSMLNTPGGILTWLGCFFTQFFYIPWLGTLIMILLWGLIYFITIKAYKIKSTYYVTALIIPTSLICSVLFTGYWIYYLKVPGYYFSGTIGTLFMMTAILIGSRLRNKWYWTIWNILWTILGYIAFGWYALVGSLVMSIHKTSDTVTKSLSIQKILTSAILIVFTPLIAYHCYTQMRIDEAWIIALPIFSCEECVNYAKSTPFIIIAITALALAVVPLNKISKNNNKESKYSLLIFIVSIILYIVYGCFIYKNNFDNYNYHCELRIHRAVDEARWQDAIDEATNMPCHPTRAIVLLRNIALMNQGNIGNTLFHYDNYTILPESQDSLAIHMLQTNAALTYLNHGRINFAIRWCIENGVEYGFNINDYKILIKCALVSGEEEVAHKYINILKQTLFYKEWAEHYEKMIGNTAKIEQEPELQKICELYKYFSDVIDGDEGLIEPYLIGWFSHTQSKKSKYLQEMTLIYAMLSKDSSLFWPKFILYTELHKGEEIPIHYQEAAYLNCIMDNLNLNLPFDKDRIISRYESFKQITRSLLDQGQSEEQVAAATKDLYGDTYWWYYFFDTNLDTY